MYAAKKPCAYFFRMPDLSSETNAVITQASAWMAWTGIQQALWQQRRKGSAESKVAAELNRLHCGIRQLASNAGCDPGTMRRQCRRLARAGLIRIVEEVPQLVQHPVTGRLVSRKSKGPIKPVVIASVAAGRIARSPMLMASMPAKPERAWDGSDMGEAPRGRSRGLVVVSSAQGPVRADGEIEPLVSADAALHRHDEALGLGGKHTVRDIG